MTTTTATATLRYDSGEARDVRALLYQYRDYCIDLLMENDGDIVLSGTVTHVLSGRPVPGVVIGSGDTRVASDAQGAFVLTLPPGSGPVQFRIRTEDANVVGNIPIVEGMYAA